MKWVFWAWDRKLDFTQFRGCIDIQWNILSQSSCSLSARMYVMVFQDQHTLPKWNILSEWVCWSWENISLLVGVLVLEDHYEQRENKSFETEYCISGQYRHTYKQREQASHSFTVCEYVCLIVQDPSFLSQARKTHFEACALWKTTENVTYWSNGELSKLSKIFFQDQHTLPKWNILSERIFHFGWVCWSWEDHYIHMSRERTRALRQNISGQYSEFDVFSL